VGLESGEFDNGIEFFDVSAPDASLPPHQMFHYRSCSQPDIEMHLMTKWEECLENNITLPAAHVRAYASDGTLQSIQPALSSTVPQAVEKTKPKEYSESHSDESEITVPNEPRLTECYESHTDELQTTSCASKKLLAEQNSGYEIAMSHHSSYTHLPENTTTSTDDEISPTYNTTLKSNQAKLLAKILPNDPQLVVFDRL